MSASIRLILSLCLAIVLLPASVLASSKAQPQASTVTKTFRLTLYGRVPQGQSFYVRWRAVGSSRVHLRYLCGMPAGAGGSISDPCVAGRTYAAHFVVPQGTKIRYAYVRVDASRTPEMHDWFHTGTETLSVSMVNTAWYRYGKSVQAGQEGSSNPDRSGESQITIPSALPDTGAGGAAEN